VRKTETEGESNRAPPEYKGCALPLHQRTPYFIHLQTETMPHTDLLRSTSLCCKRTVDTKTEMQYEPSDGITDLMLVVSVRCEFGFVSGSGPQ
jgi:hypothetical protein